MKLVNYPKNIYGGNILSSKLIGDYHDDFRSCKQSYMITYNPLFIGLADSIWD